jgi:SOS response regulatory protein OraA/RecX
VRLVTALRAPKPGRVAVELDGARWRTLPLEVVVRAGLSVGEELDRPRLRLLRRELRRHEAIVAATGALRHRDHSARSLEQKLERGGVAPAERAATLDTLGRAGLLDDARFASDRARTLAGRGWGDAAIRADLERQGLDGEPVAEAIAALDGVSEVYSVTGQIDLIAMVRVSNHDDVATVVADRLNKVDGVTATETHIAFRAYSKHDLEAAFALGLD